MIIFGKNLAKITLLLDKILLKMTNVQIQKIIDFSATPALQMIPTKTADSPIYAMKRPILISLYLTLEKCYAMFIF